MPNGKNRLCPHLKLISRKVNIESEVASTLLSMHSIREEKKIVFAPVFLDFLEMLDEGERIVFEHVHLSHAKPSYQFNIIAHGSHASSDVALNLQKSLKSILPNALFVEHDFNKTRGAPDLAYAWLIQAEPLQLRNTSIYANSDTQELSIPQPRDYPNTALTALSSDPIELGKTNRLKIKIQPYALNESQQSLIQQWILKLDMNKVEIVLQSRKQGNYEQTTQWKDKCINNLERWLQQPKGYSLLAILESDTQIPLLSLRHIARDIFGGIKTKISACDPNHLPTPHFAHAIHLEQGFPSLFPAFEDLKKHGIKTHFDPPFILPPHSGGALIGKTNCGEKSSQVAIPDSSRGQHVAIFGSTGAGKSTAMMQLFCEDIHSPDMPAQVVIDPHGNLVNDLLNLIPKNHMKDVVLIDVTDPKYCVSVNPLIGMAHNASFSHLMTTTIAGIIKTMVDTRDSTGPQAEAFIRGLIQVGTSRPGFESFLTISRLLEDQNYFKSMAKYCKNKKVLNHFTLLRDSNDSEHNWSAWAPHLLAKLTPFTNGAEMNRLINATQKTLPFEQVIEEGKILLFNLSKSFLGEMETTIAGTLLLSRIFEVARSRNRIQQQAPRPIHLYVDELASFSTDLLPRILAESRKFGLRWVSANQSLDQLRNRDGELSIAKSIITNAGTKMMFRLGANDCDILQTYYEPLDRKAMTTLPDRNVAMHMLSHGQLLPTFVVEVDRPHVQPDSHAKASEVRSHSNSQYAKTIQEVNFSLVLNHKVDESLLGEEKLNVLNDEEHHIDPMSQEFIKAAKMTIQTKCASITTLHRELGISVTRAAQIFYVMEELGIVSACDENGMRRVLINESQETATDEHNLVV